jgi:selenocysteine lyase/cysteine desulfurase
MASVRLPEPQPSLSQRLFDDHRIEIPTTGADDELLRISIAPYTVREDVERLLDALPVALRTSRSPA